MFIYSMTNIHSYNLFIVRRRLKPSLIIFSSFFWRSSIEGYATHGLENNETFAQKNQTYQNFLKQNEIAGKANFKETPNKLQLAQDFTGETGSTDGIPNSTENNSKFARRLASTDKNNIWPSKSI